MIPLKVHVFPSAEVFLQAYQTYLGNDEETPLTVPAADVAVDNGAVDVVVGGLMDTFRRVKSHPSGDVAQGVSIILSSIALPAHRDAEEDIEIDVIRHTPYLHGALEIKGSILMMIGAPNADTYHMATPNSKRHLQPWLAQPRVMDSIVTALRAINAPPMRSVYAPERLASALVAAWGESNEPMLAPCEQPSLTTRLALTTASTCHAAGQQALFNTEDELRVVDIVTLRTEIDEVDMKRLVEALVEFVCSFFGSTVEQSGQIARKMIQEVLDADEAGRLWLCVSKPQLNPPNMGRTDINIHGQLNPPTASNDGLSLSGYVYTGRQTAGTIAIRNVFTSPEKRGKGIAARLVHAASRWWLVSADEKKRKGAVSLFVEPTNQPATRAYLRSGFVIQDEIWIRKGFEGVEMGAF